MHFGDWATGAKKMPRAYFIFKHRHQRCKAPSPCKTFFITNNCRLKEASQKKDHSHNVFLTTAFTQRLAHNIFLPTFFSQRLPHYNFLTTSLSRLSHNVFLTTSFSHRCPDIFVHTTYSSQLHNIRVIFLCCKNSTNIPKYLNQTETSTLHTCNIYSVTMWRFRTLGQRLHTKVLYKYPKISQICLCSNNFDIF